MAGIERAEQYDLPVSDEVLGRPLDLARALLARRGTEMSARFVELFAEMTTVATIARAFYQDTPLQGRDLERYLDHSFEFFNSFRHP
jgi:hypothetical protein